MALRLRSPFPSLDGIDEWINGNLNIEQLKGKRMLIHFWSISCQKCKITFPQINEWKELYEQYFNLQIIGVHMPRSEQDMNLDLVIDTVQRYRLNHPIIIDNEHRMTDAFQNVYVPSYYLFDESHRLRHYQVGDHHMRLFTQRLNKVLGAVPTSEKNDWNKVKEVRYNE